MCESKLILKRADGSKKPLMDEVVSLVPTEDGVLARNIMGEEALFNFAIEEISLISHEIILREK